MWKAQQTHLFQENDPLKFASIYLLIGRWLCSWLLARLWFGDAELFVAKLVMVLQQPFLMSALLLEWWGPAVDAVIPKRRLRTAPALKVGVTF